MLWLELSRNQSPGTFLVGCPTPGLGSWHVVAFILHLVSCRTLEVRSTTLCHMMVLLADPNTSHLALEETLPGALGDVVRVGTKMSRGVEVEADPISNRVDKVTSHGLLIERSKKVYRWFRVLVCRCLV
jgi:hypothetical protein